MLKVVWVDTVDAVLLELLVELAVELVVLMVLAVELVELLEVDDIVEVVVDRVEAVDDVELLVNETYIPINPFIKSFIAKTLLGMVSSLKGIKEIKSLHISLRRES